MKWGYSCGVISIETLGLLLPRRNRESGSQEREPDTQQQVFMMSVFFIPQCILYQVLHLKPKC